MRSLHTSYFDFCFFLSKEKKEIRLKTKMDWLWFRVEDIFALMISFS